MAKIANLSADLVANTSSFEADLKRADRALNSSQAQWKRSLTAIDKQFGALGSSVSNFAGGIFSLKGAFGALTGIVGGASIFALAKDAVDAVGGLGELASQLGITTDTLQAFQYAATQVGLSTEEMQAGVAKLTRSIGDAANGSKSALDAFNAVGIGVLDANGKVRSTEEVMRDVADALQRIDDPARRASIAVDLFGKAGQKLLPFLEGGAQGIDDLVGKAKDLGLVFDEGIIASADEASDKLATLSKVLSTQLTAVLVELAPLLTSTAQKILDIVKAIRLDSTGAGQLKTLDQAIDKLGLLQDQYDGLMQQYERGRKFGQSMDIPEATDEYLNDLLGQITAKAGELERVRRVVDDLMLQNGSDLGAPASAGTRSGGSNNPPPASTGTGKSDAEKQADAVKARIEDLRFQLNQLNATPIDAAIAESLKGIKPTPEQAALISDLTSRIVGLKDAADKSDQAVKLLEQGMADFDAAQAERTNNITAIYNATRTPAEAYAAEVARLQELLGGSAENQDLLNRALDAAKTKFEEAADGTTVFRDAADEAMGILQAGLVDAIWEADNLKEAIRGVVNQLGKMLLNKGLSAAGDAILNAIFGDSATGGPEGGRTLVGERGPEIVDLPAGSYVHTAKASAPMLDQRISSGAIGAGGVTINNNVSVEGSGGTPEQNTDLADKVIGQLERSFRGMIREELADNQRAGGQLNPGMGF